VGGLLMLAGVLFVILAFVVTLVWALQRVERESTMPPEDQLAGRFARGEISESEYLRNLAILQHGTQLLLEPERSPREPGTADP
jgi:uncharacterized membrane protein